MGIKIPSNTEIVGPTPHGVGGLKYVTDVNDSWENMSHPTRGGWIEIT